MKIEMIPAVKEQDDYLMVPIYGTNDYCHILWKDGETTNDALANASPEKSRFPDVWDKISVMPSDVDRSVLSKDHFSLEETSFVSYEVCCAKSSEKYYLIMEATTDGALFHAVCLPYNRLNIARFYIEYVLPFGTVSYRKS